MNNLLSYPLFERKQVGVLYHFTRDFSSMLGILESEVLSASNDPWVSFTRDFKLRIFGTYIRISFNGDILSDMHHIEPFAYKSKKYDYVAKKVVPMYLSDEREERIMGNNIKVTQALLCVDILDKRPKALNIIESYKNDNSRHAINETEEAQFTLSEYEKYLNILKQEHSNIQVNLVNEFRPTRIWHTASGI